MASTDVATIALAMYTVVSAGQALAKYPRRTTRKARPAVTKKVTITIDGMLSAARPPTTTKAAPTTPVARREAVRRRMLPPKSAVPSSATDPKVASTAVGVPGKA